MGTENTAEALAILAKPVTITLADVTLRQAVDAIAATAGVQLQFRARLLNQWRAPVTVQATRRPLGVILDQTLAVAHLHVVPLSNGFIAVAEDGVVRERETHAGVLTGKVIDAKTKLSLKGVAIVLDGAKTGTVTGTDGTYHIAADPGAHHVVFRLLGYVRQTRRVDIVNAETTTLDVALESSVNTLDQVVVTGTVVPTALKAVPNAITIITGKELQERGVTRIYELFRGDVPGIFTNRTGQVGAENPGVVGLMSRGSTYLTGGTDMGIQEGIKTYVDGVELADKTYLGMIDPTSIERIEILTGPQASTIYGSNAINGVMQIFTKRGTTARPQVTATLKSAWTQNNFSSSVAPNHDADVALSGVEGHVSYNLGGSGLYQGSWVPSVLGTTMSGFGGARITAGPVTTDVNVRRMQVRNRSNGIDQQVNAERGAAGIGRGIGIAIPQTRLSTTLDNAVGVSGTYTMTSWWSHTMTIGTDGLTIADLQIPPRYTTPNDSGNYLYKPVTSRLTAAYNTTLQVPITSVAKAIVTVGVDESQTMSDGVSGAYVRGPSGEYQFLPGFYSGWHYSHAHAKEHGGFLQSQLGVWDGLFFTYGLRAVYNQDYGRNMNPYLEPRYGVALSWDLLGVTAKARASYGASTRPPQKGQKEGFSYNNPNYVLWFGTDTLVLSNPNLVPESQRGGEGGFDLYFGSRGSLVVTRYMQTVNDLILQPIVDSLPLTPFAQQAFGLGPWVNGGWPRSQSVNIGSVRNQGWELTGTMNLGVLTTDGTYSWTKSRLIGITPRYRSRFPQYVVGASFDGLAEHTWALGFTYAKGGTRIAYHLQGQGQVHAYNSRTRLGTVGRDFRLDVDRARMSLPNSYAEVFPGFPLGNLNVSHQLTARLEALLDVTNVTNSYKSDIGPTEAQSGRTTGIGLRARF